jgi:hypothetical protein
MASPSLTIRATIARRSGQPVTRVYNDRNSYYSLFKFMFCRFPILFVLIALISVNAIARCDSIRTGYLDQHRPPYWLGGGTTVPELPGASVELIRQFTTSSGCPASLIRMPALRLRPALAAGEIDFAPMGSTAESTPGIVFPRDKRGRLDLARSIPMVIVVFVRANDRLNPNLIPFRYFQGRTLGMTLGAAYAERLRQSGFVVDSGAKDVARNFEKLKLHRFDGFAVSLISPGDMDAMVSEKYGGEIVRLREPLLSDNIWLAASQSYYSQHRFQVEAMWRWLGSTGQKEFPKLLMKYSDGQ